MDRRQWLALVQEEILEPDRPILDPHHHLWDDDANPYLLPELLADVRCGHDVRATVFVECASMYRADGPEALRPVGETEFVNGIAAMTASGRYGAFRACVGIVGYADCLLGADVGPVLDAHRAASPRFRGIRHAAGWDASEQVRNSHTDPPPELYLRDDFRAGFQELANRGMTFDAWLYHHQIPQLTDLARAFPDVTIVFDHFGGPLGIGPYAGRQDAIFEQWCRDAAELARCPNVVAKLGGLVMPVNGFGFHKRDRPATSDEVVAATVRYHRTAIELFGPERCMFESNFPVDAQSCSYTVLWNAFKKIAAPYGEADREWLFHRTAATAYAVDPVA